MTNPTDTNQASELYELCKEVYKLFPDWETKDRYMLSDKGFITVWDWRNSREFNDKIPLYTSDYLLEKLRRPVSINFLVKPNQVWANDTLLHLHGVSDTPLKALLKLTIALSEAGELK